jgi:hypothetical protein
MPHFAWVGHIFDILVNCLPLRLFITLGIPWFSISFHWHCQAIHVDPGADPRGLTWPESLENDWILMWSAGVPHLSPDPRHLDNCCQTSVEYGVFPFRPSMVWVRVSLAVYIELVIGGRNGKGRNWNKPFSTRWMESVWCRTFSWRPSHLGAAYTTVNFKGERSVVRLAKWL